jgi:hypothetical protein
MKNSFWSSFHNQATLAYNKSLSFGFNYENRFNIKELGTRTAAVLIPSGKASLAAVCSSFGYTDFKRDMAGLACGLKLSEKLSAGIQVDYYSQRTSGEYNNNQTVTCEAGLLISPSRDTRIGIHVFNLVPNSLIRTFLPMTVRIGAGTYLNKILFNGIETEMSTGGMLIVRTGFEYEAAKKIWLRGGYSTEFNSFSFGLGWLVKFVQMDIGFMTHETLGVTSSASLIFKIH